MTKLPFKRLALAIGVASTLVLAGCSSEEADPMPVAAAPTPVPDLLNSYLNSLVELFGGSTLADVSLEGTATTYAVFSPLEGALPFPTDFLFAAAGDTDGTAAIDATDDPTNPVLKAINDLDGWSTNAQIDIAFSGQLDPATVKGPGAGQNVFLIVLDTGDGDALDPANIEGVDSAATTALQSKYVVSTISVDGGTDNAIRISPTAPLDPARKYLAFVLSDPNNHPAINPVKDIDGAIVGASASYSYFGDPANNATLDSSAPTAAVRSLVQGLEAVASGFLNAVSGGAISAADAKASLVVTSSFTTTDPTTPLLAMGAPRAALLKTLLENSVPAPTAAASVATLAPLLSTPKARTVSVNPVTGLDLGTLTKGKLSSNIATLYTGAIELPTYSPVPASNTDTSAFFSNWSADQTLGAQISPAVGMTVPPADDDGSHNVTYRYPFAQAQTSLQKVPLQITMPKPGHAPAAFGGATCADAYGGGAGYPVVIYIHGITSDRTSVAALAHSLANNACIATVAIDLPLHGVAGNNDFYDVLNVEDLDASSDTTADPIPFQALYPGVHERHFNQKQNPLTALPVAMSNDSTDSSGSLFINLLHLQNTRDNLKQAVMDLLNLNASLSAINALDIDGNGNSNNDNFDLTKVSVVGVSLGGMVGTTFTAINQLSYAADAQAYAATGNNAAFAPTVNPIKRLAVSVGGVQLTKILENSQTFGPTIVGALGAAGAAQGTSDFDKFLYVAQSTVDSADPLNFASTIVGSTLSGAGLAVPTLLQEIVGGGDLSVYGDVTDYVADTVVPNNAWPLGLGAANPAPLAGTDPLAELMGASEAVFGVNNITATSPVIARMEIGNHGSLLRPAATVGGLLSTTEMQKQVVSFVVNPAQTAIGASSITLPDEVTVVPSCDYVAGLSCP